MYTEIAKAENGWIVTRTDKYGATIDQHIATDATLGQVVCQVVGISPLADLPQTVEDAPAPETDEEVPGEAEAVDEEVPGEADAWGRFKHATWLLWPKVTGEIQDRFRAALRVAIEADRKKRGVGGVITQGQLKNAIHAYNQDTHIQVVGMTAAFRTLGIMIGKD